MFTNRKHWVVGVAAGLLVAGCTPGGFLNFGGADAPANKVLAAKLGAEGGAQAYVEFDDDDGHQEFDIEVSGGEPGASVEVSINGVVVLSVTLDEFGNAHLQFDSNPDEPDEAPLPMEFPGAGEGDAVGVGELSGNFEEEDEGHVGDHDDGEQADEDEDDGDDADHDDDAVADHDDGEAVDQDDSDADEVDDTEDGDADSTETENDTVPAENG